MLSETAGLDRVFELLSVKAVRVYDRGVCSAVEDLTDDISKLLAGYDDDLCQQLNGDPDNPDSNVWTKLLDVRLALRHPEGTASSNASGSLVFQLESEVTFDNAFLAGCDVHYVNEWELFLDGGVLAARQRGTPRRNGTCFGGPLTGCVCGEVLDGVAGKLAEYATKVREMAAKKQRLPGTIPADCSATDPCGLNRFTVAAAAATGADLLGIPVGDANRATALAFIQDPGNWTCVPSEGDDPSTCEMDIHASRVNVYPNRVELVWFDGPAAAPAAFTSGWAAFLAALGSGSVPALERLCTPDRRTLDDGTVVVTGLEAPGQTFMRVVRRRASECPF